MLLLLHARAFVSVFCLDLSGYPLFIQTYQATQLEIGSNMQGVETWGKRQINLANHVHHAVFRGFCKFSALSQLGKQANESLKLWKRLLPEMAV